MTAAPARDWIRYKQLVRALPYGKILPAAVYLHRDMEPCRTGPLGHILASMAERHGIGKEFNVVKFRTDVPRLSFLSYPGFFDDPHPALEESVAIDLSSGKSFRTGYRDNINPPILHRKELLLAPGHPRAQEYAALSAAEDQAGLYDDTAVIGFRLNWQRLLAVRGLVLEKHTLIRIDPVSSEPDAVLSLSSVPSVQRHKTALTRYQLSKPVKTLFEFNQMRSGFSFFDYGCGHGSDVRGLRELGFEASGWDPVHSAEAARIEADVVNLGYVLNVIEDPAERLETLVSAWRLARRLLIVSALIGDASTDAPDALALNDGVLTRRNTFQKYFSQRELQSYIEDGLEVSAVPVSLGVFYVFRNSEEQELFLQSRSRRSIDWNSLGLGLKKPVEPLRKTHATRAPRPHRSAVHQVLLDQFFAIVLQLGRLPLPEEFPAHSELCQAFGSAKRALRHLLSRGGQEAFNRAEAARKADLLVYLAMAHLRRILPFACLPEVIRHDIKVFFRSYKRALAEGRSLLHSAGDSNSIVLACEETTVGWQDERSFYVHTALVDRLPTVLRTFVACAELLFGNILQAEILKIHKYSGKVTFMTYSGFDSALLPALTRSTRVNLRTQRVEVLDHVGDGQLLYFKERFIDPGGQQCSQVRDISEALMKLGISNVTFLGPKADELYRILSAAGRDDLIEELDLS